MKKILAALLVLALVAPAMAVNFTLTPGAAGSGKLTVAYDIGATEVVRGMALKVTVLSGNAVVDGTTDVVLNNAVEKFNTFVDYAFDNAGYTVGAGHAIADAAAAGVATLPATVFSVSMGYLDEDADATKGEGLTVDSFFDIFFTLTTNSVVKVEADTLRGGIVGDNIVASNLPLQANLTAGVTDSITGPAVVVKTTAAPAIATRVNGGRVETFSVSGVTGSSTVEYQFTFGDGTQSAWSTLTTASKTYSYTAAATYNVTCQARLVSAPTFTVTSAVVALTTEAYKSTATAYATWAQFGRPNCWAFQRNCRGDGNGLATGLGVNRAWVNSADLTILAGGFNKIEAQLAAIPNGICADFNRLATGLGVNRAWVNSADLTILAGYFNKVEGLVPVCGLGNLHYYTN